MKILIMLLLSVLATVVASAQVKVSIVACPQFNESFGVRMGSDLNIPLSSRWSFVPGAYWSLRNRHNTRNSEKNGSTKKIEYSDKAHFITLPLRFGLRIPCKKEENFALAFLFGPYIAYGLDGDSKSVQNTDGVITHHQTGAFDSEGRYKSRWDYGLNVSLNSTIKQNFIIGIFCETGLRGIYKANNAFESIISEIIVTNKINMAFGTTFGYRF